MRPHDFDPIDVTIAGRAEDPRSHKTIDGFVIHRVPYVHPDDIVELPNGLRVTTVARTLIDLAEVMEQDELREAFENAKRSGSLDMDALHASRARVECVRRWRCSTR